MHKHLSLIEFLGRSADRNERGMAGAAMMGAALSQRLGIEAAGIGTPQAPLHGTWQQELDAAQHDLQALAQACERAYRDQKKPLIAMGRCASSLATLPVLARQRPDALLVWFDAHGDSNTPETTLSGYLGGMVIAGAAGLWNSGLGSGLGWPNVLLVGARDLDPGELVLIADGTLHNLPSGAELPARLRTAIGNRPVYVHLDCDVLESCIVPTEYRVPGGLSLDDLRVCCDALAQNEIVGIEIAEFEATWAENGKSADPAGLIGALQPLFSAML